MNIYSKPAALAFLSALVILVGTTVTMFIPLFLPSTHPVSRYVMPYTSVELEGRDIYIREGCNNCHTQMVRPLISEVLRYGEYSKGEEYAWDRPFLWGSRRIGPDLIRVGGKYPDSWHYRHLQRPRSVSRLSIMPPFGWLASNTLDTSSTFRKTVIQGFGYTRRQVSLQIRDATARVTDPAYSSKATRDQLTPVDLENRLTEMDALVAYLQKLGRDVKSMEATR
jgi:cytochrome c oxidase cbb3-type subunit 2